MKFSLVIMGDDAINITETKKNEIVVVFAFMQS